MRALVCKSFLLSVYVLITACEPFSFKDTFGSYFAEVEAEALQQGAAAGAQERPPLRLLNETIRVVRDAKGIPHIYAQSDPGAMFGLGYASAEDRLFQMHFARMKAKGRLAEIFGRTLNYSDGSTLDLVGLDKKQRIYGFERHILALLPHVQPETLTLLEAYSAGVNLAINDMVEQRGRLPIVFAGLDIAEIDDWTPVDSLLAYLLTAAMFTKDGLGETLQENSFAQDVAEACGAEPSAECIEEVRAQWLYTMIDEDAAVIPEPPTNDAGSPAPGMTHIPVNKKASHVWAIAGQHTTTGLPYLNGRPMLHVKDRLFYHSHVKGATFDVQGAGFPGIFGYLVGSTTHTAWSVTSMYADNADLFRLQPGATDNTYLINGQEMPLEVWNETIAIKGEAAESLTIRHSRFGAIVNELLPADQIEPNKLYAQRYIITEFLPGRSHPVEGLLGMMRADHWQAFRNEGLYHWSYPNANLVYADDGRMGPAPRATGNICYRPATMLPVRSANAPMYGLLPQDVQNWSDNWTGYLGIETIPEICNPDKGFLVSANHLPVGSWWGYYGLGGSGESARSFHIKHKVRELIAAGPISPRVNEALHRDAGVSKAWSFRDVSNYFAQHPDYAQDFSVHATLALEILNAWNGEARQDVREYRLLSWEDPEAVGYTKSRPIDKFFWKNLKDIYGNRGSSIILFMKRFADSPDSALRVEDTDGARVDLHENAFKWVHTALKRYWNEATGLANPNTCVDDPVECLKSNETNYRVLFGTYGTFKEWPLGTDHDFDVELLGAKSLATIWSIQGNIYSAAVQLGNPNATMTQVSVGNSDDPESPYFNNTVEEWADGQHRRTPMKQTLVEAQALEIYDLVYQP